MPDEARVSMIKVVDNDIETLATALYVKVDDMLRDWPDLAPARPVTGTALTLSDAELVTLAVMSALPVSEITSLTPVTFAESVWLLVTTMSPLTAHFEST